MGVYIIAADRIGPVKIGMGSDPVARLRALQTGHPQKLMIFHYMHCDEPQNVEKTAHDMLRPHALNGEWFNVSVWSAFRHLIAADEQVTRDRIEQELEARDLWLEEQGIILPRQSTWTKRRLATEDVI
jgi:hypothetical protein